MNETEHLLEILSEECAEVQVRISKALRFGLLDVEPGQGLNNAARINAEIADVEAVLSMLYARGILRAAATAPALGARADQIAAKIRKVEKFMAFSKECGTLETEP